MSRRRAKRVPHEERREEILRVALELFASQGIDGTGLRAIADRVGVSQPALYHYFPSKDALVDALMTWRNTMAAEKQRAVTQRLGKVTSLRQGLALIAESLSQFWHGPENQDFHRLVISEMTRQGSLSARLARDFLQPTFKWAEGLFTTLIDVGKLRDLDPGLLAVQFVGPLLMMGLWHQRTSPEHGRERFSQLLFQHLEVMVRGLER